MLLQFLGLSVPFVCPFKILLIYTEKFFFRKKKKKPQLLIEFKHWPAELVIGSGFRQKSF